MVRCGECGHSMAHVGHGYMCIENTCYVGLACLGDYKASLRLREESASGKKAD